VTWLAQAEHLAGEAREPGFGAAHCNARAWRAGVHPAATRSLVAAALLLTSGDAGTALWAHADPCPSDRELLSWTTELEAHVADLLKQCGGLGAGCQAALAQASMVLAAAAPDAEADARMTLGDCGAALEVLDSLRGALDAALRALQQVPGDVCEHYEVPYGFVRQSGPLPRDGGFLTGTATSGAM